MILVEVKKKRGNVWLRILGFLFLLYVSLSIAIDAGYYEKMMGERAVITEEKMREFEKDVREGKDVELYDYIMQEEDYSNSFSKSGYKISHVIEDVMGHGIDVIVDICKTLFT